MYNSNASVAIYLYTFDINLLDINIYFSVSYIIYTV